MRQQQKYYHVVNQSTFQSQNKIDYLNIRHTTRIPQNSEKIEQLNQSQKNNAQTKTQPVKSNNKTFDYTLLASYLNSHTQSQNSTNQKQKNLNNISTSFQISNKEIMTPLDKIDLYNLFPNQPSQKFNNFNAEYHREQQKRAFQRQKEVFEKRKENYKATDKLDYYKQIEIENKRNTIVNNKFAKKQSCSTTISNYDIISKIDQNQFEISH